VVQRLVPLELVEAGEQAVSAVERCVAADGPVVKCLLLASSFYEALKAELQETDRADYEKKSHTCGSRQAMQPDGLCDHQPGSGIDRAEGCPDPFAIQ
jgi:hypothetical protein